MPNDKHIPLSNYFDKDPRQSVFTLGVVPNFSPIDFNLEFLRAKGWSVSSDRFRFHFNSAHMTPAEHPLKKLLGSLQPHILIRKLDKEEDYFVALSVFFDGKITVLSNDEERACEFLDGLLLGFPPSFKENSDLSVEAGWEADSQQVAVFCGMLAGAMGWDPMHDIPPSLEESIVEAQKSLDIGNYKSSIVMSRRAIEGLLKFAHERLMGRAPIRKDGRSMMLNDLINAFRRTGKIPEHLLQVADSLRLLGNVPGAHPADIENYRFTRYDAEFGLATVLYFNEQYFTKIDKDIRSYYSLEIDLSKEAPDKE
jgi:HEPN domain-containing protein